MTNCPECSWPATHGHDRGCKLAGAPRSYPADAEQLPELCVPVLVEHGNTPATVVLNAERYESPTGALPNHVAIPLHLFRSLLARSAGAPDPDGIEARLSELERGVALATGVAAQATAALDRLVAAIEAERAERPRCLECDGTREVPTNDGAGKGPCPFCIAGTPR